MLMWVPGVFEYCDMCFSMLYTCSLFHCNALRLTKLMELCDLFSVVNLMMVNFSLNSASVLCMSGFL
jgi:hypothetical protein